MACAFVLFPLPSRSMFELKPNDQEARLAERLALAGYWPAVAARFLSEGKYSRAVEVCREGLQEEPGVVSGRVTYGRALYHAGQIESATEQFYEALARDPENVAALKYLGDIKWAEGDEWAAVAHYRRVLEIDPWCRELKCEIRTAVARPRDNRVGREDSGSAPGDDRAGFPELRSSEPDRQNQTLRGVSDLGSSEREGSDRQETDGVQEQVSAKPESGSVEDRKVVSGVAEVCKEAGELAPEGTKEAAPGAATRVVREEAKAAMREATMRTITLKREAEEATELTAGRGRLREVPFYTETIGDLYLAQGHYQLAAEVYRVLYERGPAVRLKEKWERAEKKAGKE